MVNTLLLITLLSGNSLMPNASDCYVKAQSKSHLKKIDNMPLYLELLGIYRSEKNSAEAESKKSDNAKGKEQELQRDFIITLMRDGDQCFALLDILQSGHKRRGIGENVQCRADGHVQFEIQRLFDDKPKSAPKKTPLSIWGMIHGRSLKITIEDKNAAGSALRQEVYLKRQQPAAVADFWREHFIRKELELCAAAEPDEPFANVNSESALAPVAQSPKQEEPKPKPKLTKKSKSKARKRKK
ncbi:MAG: hypothetical protein JW841_18825 [Deltaproteobacteria bacterium]|nr:hypothetical protein [Deltaproteobacteria bacterium]